MNPKNYNGRRKPKNSAEHEIAGWILTFASGFLLLFAAVPFIFGPVSGVASAFLLGVFGITVYPILVCLFILGIFLIQGRKLAATKFTLLCIGIIALFCVFILHLATTFTIIRKPFAEYTGLVFSGPDPETGGWYTVGGVFFGTLVYGIQSVLTPVVSFVVFSAAVVLAAFLMINRIIKPSEGQRRGAKAADFKKRDREPASVAPISDRSLYVDKIIPVKSYESTSGKFSELPEQDGGVSAHSDYSMPLTPAPAPEVGPAPAEQFKNPDGTYKSKAHEILFGGRDANAFPFSVTPPGSYSYSSPSGPPVYTAPPDIKPHKPPKIVHGISDYGLPEAPFLPEKDFSGNVVSGGGIVNGDELSRTIAEATRPRPLEGAGAGGQGPGNSGQWSGGQRIADNSKSRIPSPEPRTPNNSIYAHVPAGAAVIPEKYFEDSFVTTGSIVNGDELSRDIAEQNRPRPLSGDRGQGSGDRGVGRDAFIAPRESGVRSEQRQANQGFGTQGAEWGGNVSNQSVSPTTPHSSLLTPHSTIDPSKYDSSYYTRYDGFNVQKIQPVKLTPKTEHFEPRRNEPELIIENEPDELSESEGELTESAESGLGMKIGERNLYGESGEEPDEDAQSEEDETIPNFQSGFQDDIFSSPHIRRDRDDVPGGNNLKPSYSEFTGFYEELAEKKASKESFSERTASLDAFLNGQKPAKAAGRGAKTPLNSNQIPIEKYLEGIVRDTTPAPKPRRRPDRYNPPPIDLLPYSKNAADEEADADVLERAAVLEQTLQNLKLPAKVAAVTRGPAVTRYELEMPTGIPVKRIDQFETDIEYYLACNGKIRLETPIPGKRAVGVEVPNKEIDIVGLRDIIDSKEFRECKSNLAIAVGKDIAGKNIICELDKMPHLLIAGATGSGKSVCLNSVIMSIVYKSSPEDVRLILVDPKLVEFTGYKNLPHLLTGEIITDSVQAFNTFKWLKEEMDRRYLMFSKHHLVKNLGDYNRCDAVKSGEEEKLPAIVLIVDELAELMLGKNQKELEEKIMSMSQKARAAGIHLILATQRPSVDVITGTIKANLPSRIAFSVKSIFDSRTILDSKGAEALLGRGDMLYAPIGVDDPKRVQGAFVTNEEVAAVIEYVKEHNEAVFDTEFLKAISVREKSKDDDFDDDDDDGEDTGFDPLMPNILKLVLETGTASTSFIQRRFSIGFARAARIMDAMEENGFIGPLEGSKPRAVLATWDLYRELFGDEAG
ncbi:MAG: FtsK/SpoIIIE domain-containing protein [Firmicutes bacterium]|nr:FtsK/SpoIIIE domain-containing protein [Bacillota bacterium]